MKKIAYLLIAAILLLVGLTACNKKVDIKIIIDGNEVETVAVPKGAKLTDFLPPEKAGHEFIGWFTDSGFISKLDTNDGIKKDITLYAKYKKNTYTLTFKAQGSADITRAVTYGSSLTDIPAVPYKTGHSGSWDRSSFNNITSDITINAVYTPITMTLTFKADGASDIKREVGYGGTLTDVPAVPVKTGKRGVWDVTDFSNIVENKIINAVYKDIMLTVTFVSALGEENFKETREVVYGNSLTTIPQPKSYEGHTGAWESAQYTNIISDLIVNAIYTPMPYIIKFFDANGNEIHILEIAYGVKISDAVAAITDDGIKSKILEASNEDLPRENQSTRNVNFRYGEISGTADINSIVRQNYDFYLIYDVKINVTFHLQGGEFDGETAFVDGVPKEMIAGDTVAAPNLKPYPGYRFEGWYTAETEGSPVIFDTALAAVDFSAYAVWTQLFCDISFPDIDGITFEYQGSTEHLSYGSNFSFSVTAAIEILEIMGNMLPLTEQDGEYTLTSIEDDINIAVRTNDLDIFTLRFFEENNELPLYMRSVTQGEPLGKEPPLPQRSGAVGYWYNDGEQFDFATAISSNMDFVTRYFASNYAINYHIDNEIIVGYVEYGSTDYEFLSPTKKADLLFDGWFSDAALTVRASKQDIAAQGTSVDLFPKWIAETTVSHSVIGKWVGEMMLLEFFENGNVRINDGIYFFECAFSASETISILEEELSYSNETLIFRNKTLKKTTKSYIFVDFDGITVVMVEGNTIEQPDETVGKYWFYDEETTIPFEFGKTLNAQDITNNIIKLFASDFRLVTLRFNPMGGTTDGNITEEVFTIKKNESVLPSLITKALKTGYVFLHWALEGTQTLVDISYLNTFDVFSLNVYAVYATTEEYSGETKSGKYSATRGDEIILAEFSEDGSYQIVFFDLIKLTMRRSIKQYYNHSESGFVGGNGLAITISGDNLDMTLPDENQSITLNTHTLSYENSRYINLEIEGSTLVFSPDGITLDEIQYSPIAQNGNTYYCSFENNSITIFTALEIDLNPEIWEKQAEVAVEFPTDYQGSYEGIYVSEGEPMPFDMTINSSYATWSLHEENIALTRIEEEKYYHLEYIGMMFYFDNGNYFLEPLEGGDVIQLTKLP